MEEKNMFWAWGLLIVLVILLLILNYLKFFGTANPNIEEIPIENSSSTAIMGALTDITDLFNQHEDIEQYKNENISLKAILNQYSIYIHYANEEETTTYEFDYQNLTLSIRVDKDEENLKKFRNIYKILIESCQKRIGNLILLDDKLDKLLSGVEVWEGLIVQEEDNVIFYQLDITKKIDVSSSKEENVA